MHQTAPPVGRMMAFIDGENLVHRYEAMKNAGEISWPNVIHYPRTYVWTETAIVPQMHVVRWANYYTYVQGDAEALEKVAAELKALKFRNYEVSGVNPPTFDFINQLYPIVFQKLRGQRHGKGIDIRMTTDILHHTYGNHLDAVFLVSGDGDYVPVVTECQQAGKQVIVAALSSGIISKLKFAADLFIDLDQHFFIPHDQWVQQGHATAWGLKNKLQHPPASSND